MCHPGKAAEARVNADAANRETVIIWRRPILSEITLATNSVMAIAPVAIDTTKLAPSALTWKLAASAGSIAWTL
jgi:hypothetical protein